ncbi:MAG: hypothetical protein ISR58_16275 [Anaerolineales bacterium]|nr:hypothetical protein [Chloroflexota bacterium]MBL6982732.1 hypothetical protein [Anaerolineales bacterium]
MEPKLVDLLLAVQRGRVGFKAWAESSYYETRVKLENKTRRQIWIDVSRTGLISKTGESQRIGLCYPVGSEPGEYIQMITAGEEKEIFFYSRCLDQRGKPPSDGMEYMLLPELLPDYAVFLLRQGVDQKKLWETIDHWGGDLRKISPIPVMVDKINL